MSDERLSFASPLVAHAGAWPAPPGAWSYSSLREFGECPRRWALQRATYPGLWQRGGYPPRTSIPALVGEITHRVLEAVLVAFHSHGCLGTSDPTAAEVMRTLGGFTVLIDTILSELIAGLEDNPRMRSDVAHTRSALQPRVPEIRQHVQSILSRTPITMPPAHERSVASADARGPLAKGSHAEVELNSSALRLRGRLDLVTVGPDGCDIIDYKTGAPAENHQQQLRMYALLWRDDREANPAGLPVRQLVVGYPSHDEHLDPPTPAELDQLATMIARQIDEAEQDLAKPPPPARPAPDLCRYCGVRQLCEEYWEALAPNSASELPQAGGQAFVDCELSIVRRNGPRSWEAIVGSEEQGDPVLLRTHAETVAFEIGARIRIVGLVASYDDDAGRIVLGVSRASELFAVASSTP